MRHRHLARWSATVTVAAAATLTLGLSLSSPAATAATESGAASGAAAAASPSASHGTACTKTADGRLVNCPKPLAKSALPAAAKNSAVVSSTPSNLAALVDTRTWTSGGGNTYPGADVPFGMVQWSPDTSPHRSDGGGYNYGDTSLLGYSLTHISGPGCAAAGDVPILPMTGALPSGNPNSLTTSFTNTGEVAQAGYYSAQSNMPNTITSEFTATPHTSMGRFTFPSTTQADFLVKLQDSQSGNPSDSAQIVSSTEITGTDTDRGFCGDNSGGNNNATAVNTVNVHFDIVFSQPFTASQIITESGASDPAAVFLTFDTTSNPVIDAKVAISYVSTANAQLNLQTENSGWDFDSTMAAAQASWNQLLGKIQVSGGSEAQTQEFYSLLYKDFMQPNITSDVNGQYMGADMQVHTVSASQQNQYGIYSGWDIYHSLAELQAMLDPQAASDQAQSLVNYYTQDQILQQWGYLNLNSYVMVGDPADSLIADYYAFGARNFDTGQALADMLKQATTVNDVRPGEALEQQYGYLPEDGTYGCCNAHGQVATLLEYDSEDLALSQFAAALGDTQDAAMLQARANNWENVFDPADNLLTPRNEDGQFVSGITPTNTSHYVEGDAYEYLWNVPNDYSALFSLLGGNSAVAPLINQYLSKPNGFGMYAELSNEFDFGEQYMPDYDQDPAGTQLAVNTMLATMQAPGPSGLPNNDDLGANSSATVWEMLGMYPENSGTDTLVFSGPHFPHASISLPNGNTITINAPAQSAANFYVQNLKLNGSPYQQLSVPFSTLTRGATLDWTMGPSPSTWGDAPQDVPPSYTAGLRPVIGYTSAQQVTVAPGGTATVQVEGRNATTANQTMNASVSIPSGSGLTITQAPANGSFHVPPSGTGSLTLTITASALTPQALYSVPVTFTTGSGSPQTETLTVDVFQPGSLLTAAEPNLNLAAGGQNQATYTITNQASTPVDVTLTDQATAGVTSTLSATSVSVPAGGSAQVTDTVANPSTATGTGALTVTATASNGTATAVLTWLHFTSDLALNTYQTPYPASFATSNQAPFPPSLAFDGSTSDFWTSAGTTAGQGPTPQNPIALGVNFGGPVTIGSVTMTPRPGYGPTNYFIQTSSDGQNWTTVATVTSAPSSGSLTTAITPTTAQWLRLLITGSQDATDRNVQVAELVATAP